MLINIVKILFLLSIRSLNQLPNINLTREGSNRSSHMTLRLFPILNKNVNVKSTLSIFKTTMNYVGRFDLI